MQMDAAMGAVTAIQDLFACDMNGVIYFFRGIPDFWKHCSFENLYLPGGVIASGVREAVDTYGFLGVFKGPLTAASAGIGTALTLGLLASLLFRSHPKRMKK